MHAKCPHCTGRMYVPDVYQERLIKCSRCRGMFIPEHNARPGEDAAVAAPQEQASAPAAAEFHGFDTDHATLVAMCEQAKARGNAGRYDFLSAYANAQSALQRDTWQAASSEWRNAHDLLKLVHKQRAKQLIEDTRREFRRRASDQLIEFVRQMEQELEVETAQLPRKAQRVRAVKIAAAFRKLVDNSHEPLIEPAIVGQVRRVADAWAGRANE